MPVARTAQPCGTAQHRLPQISRKVGRFKSKARSHLAVDAGLVWLLFLRAKYNPPVGEAELFWVRVIAAFGFYAVLQQWTLANQTGRGDDITAALDKFVAASPIVVAAVIEAYWLGAEGSAALSWRHHAVAALWSAFAITDFFATDITNQRLRARQFNVGDGAA
jgi:hypothetical protein